MMLGSALTSGNLLGFVEVGFVFVAYTYKAYLEEKFLVDHFKQKYVDYKRQTFMILPFIF